MKTQASSLSIIDFNFVKSNHFIIWYYYTFLMDLFNEWCFGFLSFV